MIVLTMTLPCLFAFAVCGAARVADPGLSVQVRTGLGGYFRLGTWTPLQVVLENKGPSFSGTMELSVSQGSRLSDRRSTETFKRKVFLPEYSRVTVDITAHLGNSPRPILTVLKDSRGRRVLKEETSVRHSMTLSKVSLVVGASSGYDGILGAGPGVISKKVAYVSPQEFPGSWLALRGVSTVVINGIRNLELGTPQLTALIQWVDTGGHLIIADGTGEKPGQALASSILPVFITGRCIPVNGFKGIGPDPKTLTAPQGAWISGCTRKPGADTPWRTVDDAYLGSTRIVGKGRVTYLPWDPVGRAFGPWPVQKRLWKSLLPEGGDADMSDLRSGTADEGAHRLMPDVGTVYGSRWSLLLLTVLYLGGLRLLLKAATTREDGIETVSGIFWGLVLVQTLVFAGVGYLTLGQPGLRRNTGLTEVSLLLARPETRYVEVESFINGFSPRDGEFSMSFRPEVQGLVQTTRGEEWPDTDFNIDGSYQTVTMHMGRWSSFDMLSASVVPNPISVKGPEPTTRKGRPYRRYTVTNMASQRITDASVIYEERTYELGTMKPYARRDVLIPAQSMAGDMVPVMDADLLSRAQGRTISRESLANRVRALEATVEGYHNAGPTFIGWLEKPVWDLVKYGGLSIRASVGLVLSPLESITDGSDDGDSETVYGEDTL